MVNFEGFFVATHVQDTAEIFTFSQTKAAKGLILWFLHVLTGHKSIFRVKSTQNGVVFWHPDPNGMIWWSKNGIQTLVT